jgi:uncharacterized cupredoxin-like copper-binding protein
MRHKRRPVVLGLLFLAVLFATACSSARTSSGDPPTYRVTERDFHVAAPKRVSAGDVRLIVRNDGPDAHEFIVIRARGRRLPLRSDGLTVNEEALEHSTVGVLEPGERGSARELTLHLRPGRYQLICNMSGHYLAGMHAQLVVR